GDTTYAHKLLLKCGWIFLVVLIAMICAWRWRLFSAVTSPGAVISLTMAAAGSLSLLKSQASHYFAPSAVFLAIFAALIFSAALSQRKISFSRFAPAVLFGLLVLLGAAAAFRPDAVRRLVKIADYSSERSLTTRLRAGLAPGDRLLLLQNSPL